jgi:hypothetical protein
MFQQDHFAFIQLFSLNLHKLPLNYNNEMIMIIIEKVLVILFVIKIFQIQKENQVFQQVLQNVRKLLIFIYLK